MNTKTKTILAVLVIFILTGLTVGWQIRQKNQAARNANQTQILEAQNSQQSDAGNAEQKQKAQEFSTVTVEGTVKSFKDNQLEIQNGELDNKLAVVENVFVYSKNGEEIMKKETKDLSKDVKIRAEVDMKNSTVIAVEILK